MCATNLDLSSVLLARRIHVTTKQVVVLNEVSSRLLQSPLKTSDLKAMLLIRHDLSLPPLLLTLANRRIHSSFQFVGRGRTGCGQCLHGHMIDGQRFIMYMLKKRSISKVDKGQIAANMQSPHATQTREVKGWEIYVLPTTGLVLHCRLEKKRMHDFKGRYGADSSKRAITTHNTESYASREVKGWEPYVLHTTGLVLHCMISS
jgi:hypothetical protein